VREGGRRLIGAGLRIARSPRLIPADAFRFTAETNFRRIRHFSPRMAHTDPAPAPERRNFLTKAAAIVIGGALAAIAPIAGLFVAFDPLRRKTDAGGAVRVASLNALPEDGEPRKFPVLATKIDAWNRTPNVPVGAVYLQRFKDGTVRALNVVCPHAGCFVDFRTDQNHFHCPCHNSSFALDGKILDPKSPSPRALDELAVEIRNGSEVWVKFQNFRAGTHEKIPV
jgi:menaquinol-cytochrome c reductase iron-sulfur subunit